MNDVIWKAYKLGDLFEWSPRKDLSLKNYNLFNIYQEGYVEVVTGSKTDNNNFISIKELPENYPVYSDCLCLNTNGSIGYCIYYPRDIISPTSSVHVLLHKFEKLKSLMSVEVNGYFSSIITRIFTTGIYNRTACLISEDKFNREMILLPCLEVSDGEEYIWKENGKFYTLAVEYIKKLMDEAKELREQRTIRLYESERAKYEAERAKYEVGYKKERNVLIWKSFNLGDLFEWSSRKDLSLKNYNSSDTYQEGYVEVVTGSKTDNNNFISIKELPGNYPVYSDCLCLNTNGSIGYCIYYPRDIISPTSSVHVLLHKFEKLKSLMSVEVNGYFSSIITRIFTTGIYNRTACLISEDKFNREMILLPCLEVSDGEEYIWKENGKFYTLAVEYISYIYLSGRVNYNQKLINNYTCQY